MKIQLLVEIEGEYHTYGARMNVPELQEKCFEPLKTTDDVTLAYVTGESLAGSIAGHVIMKTRKDAAEILAKQLTEMIIEAMKRSDTFNGYPLEDKE